MEISVKSIFHEILDVPDNASKEEIKTKYIEKCKKYHPDISNEENNMMMALINEAYDMLIKSFQGKGKENEHISINMSNGISKYHDQAYAFYKQGVKNLNMVQSIQGRLNLFNNEKEIKELETLTMRALYYLNIVCMEYRESEYYEDAINKIKEINRYRTIGKRVKEYSKLLDDDDSFHCHDSSGNKR